MTFKRVFASAALATGLALMGSTAMMAQNYDLHQDYNRTHAIRRDLRHDDQRLNRDIREGRGYAAAYQARDMASDRRALDYRERDIRRDLRDRACYRGY